MSRTKLFWIRFFHSIIITLMAACVFYVLFCGITGRRGFLLLVAIATIGVEGVVLFLSGWQCPLTKLAIKYGDEHERFYDSFLPKRITPFVVPGLTILFLCGLALVVF
jgi:predicted membrane channel-forming protein YqfA (hemolysin III family)